MELISSCLIKMLSTCWLAGSVDWQECLEDAPIYPTLGDGVDGAVYILAMCAQALSVFDCITAGGKFVICHSMHVVSVPCNSTGNRYNAYPVLGQMQHARAWGRSHDIKLSHLFLEHTFDWSSPGIIIYDSRPGQAMIQWHGLLALLSDLPTDQTQPGTPNPKPCSPNPRPATGLLRI